MSALPRVYVQILLRGRLVDVPCKIFRQHARIPGFQDEKMTDGHGVLQIGVYSGRPVLMPSRKEKNVSPGYKKRPGLVDIDPQKAGTVQFAILVEIPDLNNPARPVLDRFKFFPKLVPNPNIRDIYYVYSHFVVQDRRQGRPLRAALDAPDYIN
jgi:hypothetical protein